ncbi:MAG: hypothetical protein R2882_08685 [Gemmatimonadales bacterium]
MVKPRSMAAAIGTPEDRGQAPSGGPRGTGGDLQSFYLLEQFVPGAVYHVDSIMADYKGRFAVASRYGTPPLETHHDGRVFTTTTLRRRSAEEKALLAFNQRLLKSSDSGAGCRTPSSSRTPTARSTSWKPPPGRGGSHRRPGREAATGVNLWAEWARLEYLAENEPYLLVPPRRQYAGLLLSLARQEWPDLSSYDAPEVVWRLSKRHHAGLIVAAPKLERVEELSARYVTDFYRDFFTSEPPLTKATE